MFSVLILERVRKRRANFMEEGTKAYDVTILEGTF